MSTQIYKDLSLIFGPPSGDLFEEVVSLSETSGESRSKIYEDLLFDIIKGVEARGFFNEILSKIVREDLQVGDTFRTRQIFHSVRPNLEKLVSNSEDTISVPVLMFYTSRFHSPDGNPIKTTLTTDHLDALAAVLGHTLKLDWVQSIAAHHSQAA
jgi:hypothetical protein